jgi:O-antigen ligase
MACSIAIWLLRAQLSDNLVAVTWLMAATVSAWMGLLQYFGQTDIFGGWVHIAGLGEAFANLRQRNQFATLTSIGLLALLWLASRLTAIDNQRQQQTVAYWIVFTSVLVALALGNAASSSRTGMLQWCLIFALTLLWAPKPVSKSESVVLAGGALVAYLLGVLILPLLLEALTDTTRGSLLARFAEEPGCASRRVLWANVLHLIAEKPWFGWGWGELDYAHFMTLYPGERFCDILDNAHNLPLHLAVELGLPLSIGLCLLLGWWLWRNAPWAERHPTRQLAWAVLAVIGLHSLLEYPLWYGPFQMAVGLSLYLLWRTRNNKTNMECGRESAVMPSQRGSAVLLDGAAIAAIVMLAAAAWDYWRVSQLYLMPNERAAAYREQTQDKVKGSWFFQDQVQFAELTTTTLNSDNAEGQYQEALRLLHFSPESRVVQAVVESAVILGKDQDALQYLARYKAAFPDAYSQWVADSKRFKTP